MTTPPEKEQGISAEVRARMMFQAVFVSPMIVTPDDAIQTIKEILVEAEQSAYRRGGVSMSDQMVFGQISKAEAEKRMGIAHQENPCIALFGHDPMGRSCKYCRHLYAKRYSKRYYKCKYRKDTNGPGTDHRVNWPACARFEHD